MPSSTTAELERTWSRLYVAIVSIQHQVELWRGAADASTAPSLTVPLDSHPEIAEGLSAFYFGFVEDYKEHRADGATVEFFARFRVLEETVQLATKDIPRGIFGHVVSLFGATVAHLPPDAFLHERFSGAVKKLCKYLPAATALVDRTLLMTFMEAMVAKLIQEQSLSLIFADVKRPLLSTVRSLLQAVGGGAHTEFLASELSGLLLDALLALSDEYDSELETLFLELIFGLVDLLCNGPSAPFCAMFAYLGQCLEALKGYGHGRDGREEATESSLAFIDLYRSNFVDRIFARVLSGAIKARDGSMAELLEKVLGLLERGASNDLTVILMGKMTRMLDKSQPDAIAADHWSLIYLYSRVLDSHRLQSCLAFRSPAPWREASMAHRHRLEQIFALVRQAVQHVGAKGPDQAALLSGLYKCHLGAVESLLSPGYAFEASDGLAGGTREQSVPKPRETFLVLDQEKNSVLWRLYGLAKSELANFWSVPSLAKCLALCRFITQTLCFLDTIAFYAEYTSVQDEEGSLLQVLSRLLETRPSTDGDASVDPLPATHQHVDAFDQNTWGGLFAGLGRTNPTAPGTYLIMHTLLRMAAIVQARAIRPPVKIYYE